MTDAILDSLAVWWDGRRAGRLDLDRHGAMAFAYAPEWLADPAAPPLSLALPRQDEPFGDALCKAVFGGLLPEEEQRTAIARALGVSPDNPFRLLAALGGDVAGALAFLPEGAPPLPERSELPAPVPLDAAELAATLARLPLAPMLAGEGLARLSLAGAQSKLPVLVIDGQIALPREGVPSTHLIKPEPARFPGLAANEAFCLALARAVGLDAAQAERRTVTGNGAETAFLLVRRYDRVTATADAANAPGHTRRLHQEDFAQALGVPSNRKYATEGGPVLRDAFALLRRATTRPAREVLKLNDAVLFNLMIGNADAHAKNFSLLRHETGDVTLAPLYDLVATLAWPALSARLAMKFGGAARLEEVDAQAFARFARDAGLALPFVKRRASDLADKVEAALDRLESPSSLAAIIRDRAQRLKLKAGEQGEAEGGADQNV